MNSSDSPPVNIPTAKPEKKSGRNIILVIVVVAVVVVASVVGVYYLEHRGSPSNYHVANASPAEVNRASGKNLTESQGKYPSNSTYTVIASSVDFYNETSNGTTPRSIILGSFELSSQSEASSYYFSVYNTTTKGFASANVTLTNGSYGGFDYFEGSYYANISGYSIYLYIAVGHAGQFAFEIFDLYIPLSNPTILLQGEINAMTSTNSTIPY